VDAEPDRYVLQAVTAALGHDERASIERLREWLGPEVAVIDSHFDAIPRLLELLGLRPRPLASEDLPGSGVRIGAIGCPHRRTRLDAVDTERFFERGGMLISSDKAARLPGIAAHVRAQASRGPARARVRTYTGDAAMPWPAVWLDHGHVPLDGSMRRDPDVEILALDAMTGEPLAVHARCGPGALIHSVAHWVQAPIADRMTAVERRPLREVPAFCGIGNSYPGISLGAFMSQMAMLRLLLDGLSRAMEGSAADSRSSAHNEG
jgi:hypothetical protein